MDQKFKKQGLKNKTLPEVIKVGIFLCMRSLYFVFLSFTDIINGEYTGLLKSFQNRDIAPMQYYCFYLHNTVFVICVFENRTLSGKSHLRQNSCVITLISARTESSVV